jgi:ferredoxin
MAVKVDKATCTGCAACESACPVEAIKVNDKAEVNEDTSSFSFLTFEEPFGWLTP